jgi:DNA transposition AAA+ family ATPase
MTENDNIQKGLEQNARVIKERIPEQTGDAEVADIVVRMRSFMAEYNFRQATVARMLGVSPSTISEFLNGKYKGNLAKLVNKVISWMNSVTRKKERINPKPYIETEIARRIATLIVQTEAFSEEEGRIALIIGDSGHGKSICLKQYAEANKNTLYIQLDATMGSLRIFVEIAKRLRIASTGSLSEITRHLVENLRPRNIIIMLDEASNLTVKQLNQLRQIIVIKARCPLILAGNADLLRTVIQPMTKHGYESLDQFTSRLMGVLNLDELASHKGDRLYTSEDIRKLYEYGGIRLTSGAIDTLKKICMTPRSGRLRTCSHVIAALHTSRVLDQKGWVDSALIIAAIEQLDLPIKIWLPLITEDFVEQDAQGNEISAEAG